MSWNKNFQFTRVLSTACIAIVLLIDESTGRQIRSSDPFAYTRTSPLVTHPKPGLIEPSPCEKPNEYRLLINETFGDCDCFPGHLRYVKTDDCYNPYSQGPCEKGQHLVLPENKKKLECVDNPCDGDKLPYEGSCYSYGDSEPCGTDGNLLVSTESYKFTCICLPDAVPYKNSNKCYQQYKQGPCKEGEYLDLLEDKKELDCVKNPCGDGKFSHNGSCYSLDDSRGPCAPNEIFSIHFGSGKHTCTCDVGLVRHAKTKKCYKAYHQGPCEKGQYLIYSVKELPELECIDVPL